MCLRELWRLLQSWMIRTAPPLQMAATKRLRAARAQDSLGDMVQPGNIYNPNYQQATPSRNEPSSSYNMDGNRNTLRQYAQDPNDRDAEQIYNGSTFHQDTSNYFEENAGPREVRQEYSADGDLLPGIDGFQIVGEPRPGFTLTACGFPTNGTALCNFQWVRYLENGTRQSIEAATMYDHVVTADDVGTLLAVDCTPMDDNGRQGKLVTEYANNGSMITCDPEMQNDIDICISRGRANFDVFVLGYSDKWEQATLVLRRTGYQIELKHTDKVVIEEKYSANLQTKIPIGRTTQFVLVSSGGINLPFNTQGITEPNNKDSDVRLRDLIVLVMRTFQNKEITQDSSACTSAYVAHVSELPQYSTAAGLSGEAEFGRHQSHRSTGASDAFSDIAKTHFDIESKHPSPRTDDIDKGQGSKDKIRLLQNTTIMEPIRLTHRLLEEITDNFSEERKIGQGAYGKVYRGEDKNGEEIAVKMLHYVGPGFDDKHIQNEFANLRKLNHQNIVKLIGYCNETQHRHIECNGKTIFVEQTYRALCLEYLHNGSLRKHLSDECDGLDWHTRYKIIKGTCEGLKYLHEGCEKPIYHLDLKPENILLDKNMVPKLADFGLSRLISNELTRITQSFTGTFGYLPPEYIERGLVSKKLDIFSLGVVMIKIIS